MIVCGVDEAGRGPLAGPVYAAAVILDPKRPITGLRDSKLLSERRREVLKEKTAPPCRGRFCFAAFLFRPAATMTRRPRNIL